MFILVSSQSRAHSFFFYQKPCLTNTTIISSSAHLFLCLQSQASHLIKTLVPLIQSQSSERLDCSSTGLAGDSPCQRKKNWNTKISMTQTLLGKGDKSEDKNISATDTVILRITGGCLLCTGYLLPSCFFTLPRKTRNGLCGHPITLRDPNHRYIPTY